MTAVDLGQQGYLAVGSGFESLPCQKTLRFIPNIFHFSIPEISETLRGSPTKIFGTVRQKIFDGKSWYSPPPLIRKLFRYRKFFETQHRRAPLWNFSALWDKKFSTENCDTLLHKVQKSVVELMFVKTLWKLILKQLFCFVLFSTVCITWSKYL